MYSYYFQNIPLTRRTGLLFPHHLPEELPVDGQWPVKMQLIDIIPKKYFSGIDAAGRKGCIFRVLAGEWKGVPLWEYRDRRAEEEYFLPKSM